MTRRCSVSIPKLATNWHDSFHTHMLLQDFNSRVTSSFADPRAYELNSACRPSYEIERGLTLDHRHAGVSDFITGVATRLLTDQEVWIEVFIDDRHAADSPFQLAEVNGVKRIKAGTLVQEIPERTHLPEWFDVEYEDNQRVELDPSRMIQVVMPESYPSKAIQRVVRELSEVGTSLVPDWFLEQLREHKASTTQFDAKETSRTSRTIALRAAMPIGWATREATQTGSRLVNDYYYFLRELRFLHFVASMRESAEAALRQVLGIASDLCGLEVSVTAHGSLAPEQINAYIRQLELGQVSFDDLAYVIYERPGRLDLGTRKVA